MRNVRYFIDMLKDDLSLDKTDVDFVGYFFDESNPMGSGSLEPLVKNVVEKNNIIYIIMDGEMTPALSFQALYNKLNAVSDKDLPVRFEIRENKKIYYCADWYYKRLKGIPYIQGCWSLDDRKPTEYEHEYEGVVDRNMVQVYYSDTENTKDISHMFKRVCTQMIVLLLIKIGESSEEEVRDQLSVNGYVVGNHWYLQKDDKRYNYSLENEFGNKIGICIKGAF